MSRPIDEPPTEALPVIPAKAVDDDLDDDLGDDLVEGEWMEPRRRSRATVVLIVALLVALGFLAGVVVGRTQGTFSPSGGGRPAATSTARQAPAG